MSSRIDLHSFAWKAVEHHCEQELQAARERLEDRTQNHEQTQYLRGKVAALKAVLGLAEKDSGYASE